MTAGSSWSARRRDVDTRISTSRTIRWQPGPATPSAAEYDLYTVLLHEMGHLAGNAGHHSRCANTPMIRAFDTGEWWHSPTDRLIRCSSGTRSAWAASAADVRVDERTFRAWDRARRRAGQRRTD